MRSGCCERETREWPALLFVCSALSLFLFLSLLGILCVFFDKMHFVDGDFFCFFFDFSLLIRGFGRFLGCRRLGSRKNDPALAIHYRFGSTMARWKADSLGHPRKIKNLMKMGAIGSKKGPICENFDQKNFFSQTVT